MAVSITRALIAAFLLTSCYLSHQRPVDADAEPEDALTDPNACCVDLRCDDLGICGSSPECEGPECDEPCAGQVCGGVCCAATQLCAADGCIEPGPACGTDRECAVTWSCDPVGRRCVPPSRVRCLEPRPFEPVVQWEDDQIVMITVPLVTQLTDDNGDGRIGRGDVPDIVTIAPEHRGRASNARLIASSGDDGRRLWEAGDGFLGFCETTTAAAGDIDGDGTIEIVVLGRSITPHAHVAVDPRLPEPCVPPDFREEDCGPYRVTAGPEHTHGADDPRGPITNTPGPSGPGRYRHQHTATLCGSFRVQPGTVFVISHRGEVERAIDLPLLPRPDSTDTLTIADLDGDGAAEIVVAGVVIGAEGIRWADARLAGVGVVVADVNGDGQYELVTAQDVFSADGALLWHDEEDLFFGGLLAVGRVMREPMSSGPQIVISLGDIVWVRDGVTGAVVFGPIGLRLGSAGAGPPTLADYDGDGYPEIGVVTDDGFAVVDPNSEPGERLRWTVPIRDHTRGTVGSSAFDLNGDGADDAVFSDECHVRILSGRDGETLWLESAGSVTVWEYPVVADVDGDGRAELVVGANPRSRPSESPCDERGLPYEPNRPGLRVFEDRLDNWTATRTTWNEHGYHVDNIDETGALPRTPPRFWEENNLWRANPRPPDPDDVRLADLRIAAVRADAPICAASDVVLRARVENRGQIGAAAGIAVVFSSGATVIGRSETERAILPGSAEWVSVRVTRSELGGTVVAQVDDAEGRGRVRECDEANSRELTITCRR